MVQASVYALGCGLDLALKTTFVENVLVLIL